jgi:hypothetical protein
MRDFKRDVLGFLQAADSGINTPEQLQNLLGQLKRMASEESG